MFAFYFTKDYSVRFFLARYAAVFCTIAGAWLCIGYGLGKYRSLKQSRYRRSMMRLVLTVAATLCVTVPLAGVSYIEFSMLQTILLICTVFLQRQTTPHVRQMAVRAPLRQAGSQQPRRTRRVRRTTTGSGVAAAVRHRRRYADGTPTGYRHTNHTGRRSVCVPKYRHKKFEHIGAGYV